MFPTIKPKGLNVGEIRTSDGGPIRAVLKLQFKDISDVDVASILDAYNNAKVQAIN